MSSQPACITCGPSYEPLDRVRRITNFSTGEMGTILSTVFAARGFDVICFRGEGATFSPPECAEVRPFSTNASLAAGLLALERPPAIILHAAALCDFSVGGIAGADGSLKLDSGRPLHLTLLPAEKVLLRMRGWFPQALIVGWKYELDGSRADAIARAAAQIREARGDGCVVNGAAFGDGFGLLLPDGSLSVTPDKISLAEKLADWAGRA